MKGEGGNDVVNFDATDLLVDGGLGTNTLRSAGAIDLTAVSDSVFRNFQVFDLDTYVGADTLTLGAADVLAALGVLNGQLLAALERTKELGVTVRYVAGDPSMWIRDGRNARRGQSLVVWAINEGRLCADEVDRWLQGNPR